MKIEFEGILTSVSEPRELRNGGRVQDIIVTKPAMTDANGVKRGKDARYPVQLFNDKIDKFIPHQYGGKRVKVEAFLNSREFSDHKGETHYNLQIALSNLELAG